jgi:hypothetical protein
MLVQYAVVFVFMGCGSVAFGDCIMFGLLSNPPRSDLKNGR